MIITSMMVSKVNWRFKKFISTYRVATSPEEKSRSQGPFGSWEEVIPNAVCPFSFEDRGKHRHRHTHELLAHQLVVRVEGWEQLAPVSVDKVGTYFREVRPQRSQIDVMVSGSSIFSWERLLTKLQGSLCRGCIASCQTFYFNFIVYICVEW